jgi:hypothetical protein
LALGTGSGDQYVVRKPGDGSWETCTICREADVVSVQELEKAGFTESGKARYLKTVNDYAEAVLNKASAYGQVDRGDDMPIEITHKHVRQGAYSLASSYGKERQSTWAIVGHIGEYLFTAIAGIGGGNIDEYWGQVTFGVSLAVAVILIVFRLSRPK